MGWNLLQTVDRGLCHSPIPLGGKTLTSVLSKPVEYLRILSTHSKEAGKGGVFLPPITRPPRIVV